MAKKEDEVLCAVLLQRLRLNGGIAGDCFKTIRDELGGPLQTRTGEQVEADQTVLSASPGQVKNALNRLIFRYHKVKRLKQGRGAIGEPSGSYHYLPG